MGGDARPLRFLHKAAQEAVRFPLAFKDALAALPAQRPPTDMDVAPAPRVSQPSSQTETKPWDCRAKIVDNSSDEEEEDTLRAKIIACAGLTRKRHAPDSDEEGTGAQQAPAPVTVEKVPSSRPVAA